MSIQLLDDTLFAAGKLLLEHIDLCLGRGIVTGVIGANGAGKTSLLRLASGELRPDRGEVRMDGDLLTRMDREVLARRVAVLPQHSMLDFPFSVAEVLDMGRIPHMTGKSINARIVDEVVEVMELDDFKDRIYTTLSGGERQRVQIGRVICQLWDVLDEGYFLFDEPTASLDLAHQLAFLSLVGDLADKGAGVLLILHDINLAARFSDQVVLLHQGTILKKGTPAEVITNENIRAAFGVEVEILDRGAGKSPFIVTSSPKYPNSESFRRE